MEKKYIIYVAYGLFDIIILIYVIIHIEKYKLINFKNIL